MYRKIHILLLPLLAFLLSASGPRMGYGPNDVKTGWQTIVSKHSEIRQEQPSIQTDRRDKQVSRFAMRTKGQQVVSGLVLTGFAYLKLRTPWYYTRPVYYDHSNPVSRQYLSSASLRGPPAAC